MPLSTRKKLTDNPVKPCLQTVSRGEKTTSPFVMWPKSSRSNFYWRVLVFIYYYFYRTSKKKNKTEKKNQNWSQRLRKMNSFFKIQIRWFKQEYTRFKFIIWKYFEKRLAYFLEYLKTVTEMLSWMIGITPFL